MRNINVTKNHLQQQYNIEIFKNKLMISNNFLNFTINIM